MSVGRLVPWSCWEEWQQVGSWLLSEDRREQQQGIDRVAAWRCRGRVPLGVDITASLTEARLRDPWYAAAGSGGSPANDCAAAATTVQGACELGQPPAPVSAAAARNVQTVFASDAVLRSEYSLAIVRMVNGIADSAQRGRVAASVAQLAAAAGLPRMLVDLRHEASHNELPTLPALRLGCDAALGWLQTGYWGAQQEALDGVEGRASALLREYLELRVAAAAKVEADRRAGLQRAADDSGGGDDDDDGDAAAEAGDGDGGAGYNAGAAQKRRRGLMAELKALLPPAATPMLVPLLLDERPGPLDPPTTNATSCGGAAGAAAANGAATGPRQWAAWRTHLQPLLAQWPRLGGLLLGGALQRLERHASAAVADTAWGNGPSAGWAAAVSDGPTAGGGDNVPAAAADAAECAAVMCGWAAGLLGMGLQQQATQPSQQQQQQQQASQQQQKRRRPPTGKRKAGSDVADAELTASTPVWSATPDQAASAVRTLLRVQRSLCAATRQACSLGVSSVSSGGRGSNNTALLSAAQKIIGGLQLALEVVASTAASSSGGFDFNSSSTDSSRAEAAAAAAAAGLKLLPLALPAPDGAGSRYNEEGGLVEQLQRSVQRAQQRQGELLSSLKTGSGSNCMPVTSAVSGARQQQQRQRFALAGDDWAPCAIGTLPDAYDTNGQLPGFDDVAAASAGFGLQRTAADPKSMSTTAAAAAAAPQAAPLIGSAPIGEEQPEQQQQQPYLEELHWAAPVQAGAGDVPAWMMG